MITRDQALHLIEEHVENKNIIKHMFALESVMGALWEKFKTNGTKEEWMMAGLLHDGDYCETVPVEKQGIQIVKWAKEKKYAIPENVAYAMAAHNWHNTGVEPKSPMDWSIFCADSLTGLIVAAVLVLPSKKLVDLKVESVLKKFKQPSFAKGTRREDISLCEKKLGLTLEEFIGVAQKSMQQISAELGL
ncbi:MAG: phosphohydrolase [bacterium]|nr:phosphohydrolase [bacterium]